MTLTKLERVILFNQNKILAILDKENSKSFMFKAEIAKRGYEGLYNELFDSIDNDISEAICEQTHEIMSMFNQINNLIESMTMEEKVTLDLDKIKFEGFDANNDPHYRFLKFIVEEGDMYEEYRNTRLNSHSTASLKKYNRMLSAFKQFTEANNYQIEANGLQLIIDAAKNS